jgi:H-type lectin domain
MDHNVRVIAYADNITATSFTAHINSWYDTTLYGATLSWITLASNDPRYQSGSWALQCSSSDYNATSKPALSRTIVQRINFDTGFASQPKVFAGISGIDLAGDWYLSVTASDVDVYGFTINIATAANTTLYGIKVDWVAYRPNEANMWSGNVSYSGSNTHVDFGIHFENQPKIVTALTQFDISNGYNLRVETKANNVTNSSMDLLIDEWSDTEIRSATIAYLALDSAEGA